MEMLLAFFSILLIVFSLYGAFQPASLLVLVDSNGSSVFGLWCAVVVRLAFSALLWMNAQHSNNPTAFNVLSIVLLVSAFTHLAVGRNMLAKFRRVLVGLPSWAISLPCIFGALTGLFVLWGLFGPVM